MGGKGIIFLQNWDGFLKVCAFLHEGFAAALAESRLAVRKISCRACLKRILLQVFPRPARASLSTASESFMYYSVKMRAQEDLRHISGAERIVPFAGIQEAVAQLSLRALHHPNGQPDAMTITVRKITEAVRTLPALPVSEPESRSPAEAGSVLQRELALLGLNPQPILDIFYSLHNMRGAALLHPHTLERLEPDLERGVRATCMDYPGNAGGPKNHMKEALCLASKVAHCPRMVAELCMSDDPDYTTGYFASRERGYVRLHHIKEKGDARGGRLFLFDGAATDVAECLRYLEKTPVLVDLKDVL